MPPGSHLGAFNDSTSPTYDLYGILDYNKVNAALQADLKSLHLNIDARFTLASSTLKMLTGTSPLQRAWIYSGEFVAYNIYIIQMALVETYPSCIIK